MRRFVIVAGALISALVWTHEAKAQSYPIKPIRVFVTSTAGGPLDVFTRLVTNKMEQELKQPFVVEDRAGAGGHLAVVAALQAPAAPYNAPEEIAFYPTAKTIEAKIEEHLAE